MLRPAAFAQSVTPQLLSQTIPDEQDLQGFTRVRPAGELSLPDTLSMATRTWQHTISPAVRIVDTVYLNADASQFLIGRDSDPTRTDKISRIERTLYSTDGVYHLVIRLTLCDSAEAASKELVYFRRGCSRGLIQGSLTSDAMIGDESWVPALPRSGFMAFRYGRIMAFVAGDNSSIVERQGIVVTFPNAALEAVANDIMMRATQQAALVGVPAHEARLAVNSKMLSDKVLVGGKQTYVPVAAFAQAMGYTSRWDARTGGLTLSRAGRRSVTLTAGSTAAKVGTRAVALKVPVLKEGRQPVMTLADLLTLVDGRVVQKGDTLQVKV